MTPRKGMRLAAVLLAAAGIVVGVGVVSVSAATAPPRVDLRVLVITDGTPSVEAIRQQLDSEGVPVTAVKLADPSRPTINDSFLSGTMPDGTAEAHYQGVVLPGNYLPDLSPAEQTALADYEARFSVRQVDAFVYPNSDVGMNTPAYAGTLDAAEVRLSNTAKSGAFHYLNRSFTFEGNPGGTWSYGYLGRPLTDTPTAAFTPFLTATLQDGTNGVLAGVFHNAGRERLEISFGFNYQQLQFRYLAHGIVDWLTKGVHFGYWRNYFDVHIDDVFNADAIWNPDANCTPGGSVCPPGTADTTPARMTSEDVQHAAEWQQKNNFTMDLVFNGGAEARFQTDGSDPMFTTFQSLATSFRWINHTYSHVFLGCVQDFTVNPWRCKTDADGNIVWVDSDTINSQIQDNITWARDNGIPINAEELLAGEHSGTLILPQQPVDNPNFANALGPNKIRYIGLDASREPALRSVGAALGAPRHPINVFYNVSTEAEEVDEYNWTYTAKADGGSGLCETSTTTRCIEPLDLDTGWETHILPDLVRTTLGNVLQNDPRVFYMHQSNLTGDRLAYPVMDGVLSAYHSVYASNVPIINDRFSAAAEALNQQQIWTQTRSEGTVSGYITGDTVTVTGPEGAQAPLTVPNHSKLGKTHFGDAYGGERSAYTALGPTPTTVQLPSAPYSAAASAAPTATSSTSTTAPALDPVIATTSSSR